MDVTNPPPGVTEMADVLPDGLVVVDGHESSSSAAPAPDG